MKLKEITLDRDMFKRWLETSVPRPILCVGHDSTGKADPDEWFVYTVEIMTVAGFFDVQEYGAYAYLGVVPVWWHEDLYQVPEEKYLAEKDLYPDLGIQSLKCTPEQAIEKALHCKEVDEMYMWVDDVNNILRLACRAFHFERMKFADKITNIQKTINSKYRYVVDDGVSV